MTTTSTPAKVAQVGDVVRFASGRNAYTVTAIDDDGIATCENGGLTRFGPVVQLIVIGRPVPAVPATTTEYQATLTCRYSRDGRCPACRREGMVDGITFVVAHPDGPFATRDAALDHARGMAQKVYGGEHDLGVQVREVTPWIAEAR